MVIDMNSKNIDLDNVYFGYEAGRYYDSENKEFCTFVDSVIVEKTNFMAKRGENVFHYYVDVLTRKAYLLNNKNKILDHNTDIINYCIEDMISVTSLFKEYKEIEKESEYNYYADLINKFGNNNIVSRKLFLKNLDEIISLKNYVYDYKNEKFNNKVRTRTK